MLFRKAFRNCENLNTWSTVKTIQMIGKIHLQATNASDSLNKVIFFHIIHFSGMFFLYTVFALFSCYMYYYTDVENMNFRRAAHNSLLWDIFFLINFTYLICLSHRIKKEGKFTGILANYFVNKCKSIEIQERLHYLSNQVQNNFPEPSCGLFKFDWPYFYNVGPFNFLEIFLNSCFLNISDYFRCFCLFNRFNSI